MNSLKTNLIYILIIALLIMILYVTCNHKAGQTTTSSSDTTTQIHYVYYKDTSRTKPVWIKGGRDTIFENTVEYVPSENYSDLVEQFTELKQILLSRNIYLDSIHLDSLGWVKVTDTVQKNTLVGRNVVRDIKIPVRETTIVKTVEAPKKRDFYLGGSMFVTPSYTSPFANVSSGFMYKDKQDRLFGAQVQWDGKKVNYGLSGYLKLSFRKTNK
jgi:hypothetical protein